MDDVNLVTEGTPDETGESVGHQIPHALINCSRSKFGFSLAK